jgi:Zonular occludens toxin (Zot)
MIHFISGKPGAGKSLYCMRLIVDELRRSNRPIVTNLPIKIGELNDYLQDDPCDVVGRVFLIDDDEMGRFWEFRGSRKAVYTNDSYKVEADDIGVFYVLDELHIKFNARAWASTGKGALFYLSQHRKIGDDVICATQSINNVDKQFRSVAQDFTYISNNSKKRLGPFRLPPLFSRSTYLQPKTGNEIACLTGYFRLDIQGLARCYDTAAGVGVIGRSGADTKQKVGGLAWYWAFGALGLISLGVFWAAKLGATGMTSLLGGFPSAPAIVSAVVPSVTNLPPSPLVVSRVSVAVETNAQDVVLVAMSPDLATGRVRFTLSDGVSFDSSEGAVLTRRGVVFNGREYSWRR